MSAITSQGSAVSWGGGSIGYLTSIRATPANAVFEDSTNVESAVIGSGIKARVQREYVCVAIDPGTIELALYGVPPFSLTDIGDKAVLSFTTAEDAFAADAFLESWDVTANVGDLLTGTARFRFA